MSTHKVTRLPSAQSVAAGSISIVRVPTGNRRNRAFDLKCWNNGALMSEAEMKQHIKQVSLKLNGISKFDLSATDIIDLLNKYKDRAVVPGHLLIPFADDYARYPLLEDALALNLANVATAELEVTLGSSMVNPRIEAFAFESFPEVASNGKQKVHNLDLYREIRVFNYKATGAGEFEISDLPKGNGSVAALHIKSNKIKGLRLKVDNVEVYNGDIDVYNLLLSEIGSRIPQAGYVHIDTMILDRLNDILSLKGVGDFRLILDMAEAEDIRLIMETINTFTG